MTVEIKLTEKQAQALVDAGFEYLGDYQDELDQREMDNLQKGLRQLTQGLE